MSDRKDRRVSYGLGQIFSTPAGGRPRAVTRGQQQQLVARRRESLRATPTGFANRTDPLDMNDLYHVLERHGISLPLNPNKPPSSNSEVHEMLRVLLGQIDKLSAGNRAYRRRRSSWQR